MTFNTFSANDNDIAIEKSNAKLIICYPSSILIPVVKGLIKGIGQYMSDKMGDKIGADAIEWRKQPEGSSGWRVMVPISDPTGRITDYLVLHPNLGQIPQAARKLLNEAKERFKQSLLSELRLAAIADPELFFSAKTEVEIEKRKDTVACDDDNSLLFSVPSDSVLNEEGIFFDINGDNNYDDYLSDNAVASCEEEIQSDNSIYCAQEAERSDLSSDPTRISPSNRKLSISPRYDSADKDEEAYILKTLNNMTVDEMKKVFEVLYKNKINLLKKYAAIDHDATSRFRLKLETGTPEMLKKNHIKGKYRYILTLQDKKNKNMVIKFSHSPSLCIYVMYLIDRISNEEIAGEIDFRKNKDEFFYVYRKLVNADMENTQTIYSELFRREISLPGEQGAKKYRDGRLKDYHTDIHRTIEGMVGIINSIPLKVGGERTIGISPELISLPDEFKRIRIKPA